MMAMDSVGNVYAWGSNRYGVLGDGTTTNRNEPVKVKNSDGTGFLSNINWICAGDSHSMAVDSDGVVWSWGGGAEGKMGLGDNLDHYYPQQINGQQ